MKQGIILFFAIILAAPGLFAQQMLAGKYFRQSRSFHPADTNVLVKDFDGHGLAPFMIKGKNPRRWETNRVGFIDTTGRMVIPPQYANVSIFENDATMVVTPDNRMGIINRKAEAIIPPDYDWIKPCTNGLYMVSRDGKIGFLTNVGKVVLQPGKYIGYAMPHPVLVDSYDSGEFRWSTIWFYEKIQFGRYIGMLSGKKWAIIDSTGTEVVPPTFDGIEIFKDDIAPFRSGRKFGAVNSGGKVLIPPVYDMVNIADDHYAIVQSAYKEGVHSFKNKLVIPVKYNQVSEIKPGIFAVLDSAKWGVVNAKNKAIIPAMYSRIEAFAGGYGVENDDGWALFDANGKRLSDFIDSTPKNYPVWAGYADDPIFVYNERDRKFHKYRYFLDFRNSRRGPRSLFYYRNKKWGAMDTLGQELTRPVFDTVNNDVINYVNQPSAIIAATKNKKWGIINQTGKTLLNFEYDQIYRDALWLIVKKDNKSGVLTRGLVWLTPIKYDHVVTDIDWSKNKPNGEPDYHLSVQLNNKWAALDDAGKEITGFKYDAPVRFNRNLGFAQIGGKTGLLNAFGKPLTDCIYDEINFEGAGHTGKVTGLIVKLDGKYGLIDPEGNSLAAPVYERITPMSNPFSNKYSVILNGKTGVLNADGTIFIPLEYKEIHFYDGSPNKEFFTAKKGLYYGLLNRAGKEALPFIYTRVQRTEYNYEIVKDGLTGLLDIDLKQIIPPEYDEISFPVYGSYQVKKGSKYGLVDTKTNDVVVAPMYDKLDFFNPTEIIVNKNGKYGVIDHQGKVILPCIYNKIVYKGGKIIDKN